MCRIRQACVLTSPLPSLCAIQKPGRVGCACACPVLRSVVCLEETISTLDYAHRAKNIRNRPEVRAVRVCCHGVGVSTRAASSLGRLGVTLTW
jgi:hypothetical protein